MPLPQKAMEFDILLVEDGPIEAEFEMKSLKRDYPGVNIFWVTDGLEAIDFLFGKDAYAAYGPRQELQLVLLDLGLKKLSGLEVLKVIRAAESTKTLPVVIVTGSQSEADRHECFRLGANGYLIKPIDPALFAKTLCESASPFLRESRSTSAQTE